MAQAGSENPRPDARQSDRRTDDRRAKQQAFSGGERREAQRRSGQDRRDS